MHQSGYGIVVILNIAIAIGSIRPPSAQSNTYALRVRMFGQALNRHKSRHRVRESWMAPTFAPSPGRFTAPSHQFDSPCIHGASALSSDSTLAYVQLTWCQRDRTPPVLTWKTLNWRTVKISGLCPLLQNVQAIAKIKHRDSYVIGRRAFGEHWEARTQWDTQRNGRCSPSVKDRAVHIVEEQEFRAGLLTVATGADVRCAEVAQLRPDGATLRGGHFPFCRRPSAADPIDRATRGRFDRRCARGDLPSRHH